MYSNTFESMDLETQRRSLLDLVDPSLMDDIQRSIELCEAIDQQDLVVQVHSSFEGTGNAASSPDSP